MKEGQILIYSDACSRPDENIMSLLNRTRSHLLAGYQSGAQNRFAKVDSFHLMGAMGQAEDKKLIQRWASVLAFSNCESVRRFVQEWLTYYENDKILLPGSTRPERDDFIRHNNDQAVLSIMTHKYAFGDFISCHYLGHHAFDHPPLRLAVGKFFAT